MQAGVGDNSELPSGVHHLIGDRPTPDPTGVAVLGGGEWRRRYSVLQSFKKPDHFERMEDKER
jgi:hypothetical protein